MNLYDYYRSSCCYRVRIALNLKQIHYDKIPIHLINNGGEQHSADYLALNPQGLVPALDDNGHLLTQSLAIIEYLDRIYPTPPLLPENELARAHVHSLSLIVACDIHPINNLRVLNYLREHFQATEENIIAWYHQWLKEGFDAFEKKLSTLPRKQAVCYGSDITLADICLIPQVYNALRYQFSLQPYPLIAEIYEYCQTLSAFKEAAPE